MESWGPSIPEWLQTKMDSLKAQEKAGSFEQFRAYLTEYKPRNPNTIDERIRHLKRMETHPKMPVQLNGRLDHVVLSFYLFVKYRKEVEGKEATALINDFKAMRSWGSYLGIPDNVWPQRPRIEWAPKEIARSPDEIYELVHFPYFDHRRYEAALLKGLFALGFYIGPRAPSELHALKIDDFKAKYHEITIRQPKKGGKENPLPIEPEWICCSPRHLSIQNYVRAREKVDTGQSDAFFLQPDGSPFTSKATLADFMTDNVKKKFPWFHPSMMRSWCATARLIDSGYDYVAVANWLDHDSVEKLRKHYDRHAHLAERRYGKNWLIRIARRPAMPKEPQAADRRRSKKRPVSGVSLHDLREKRSGPARVYIVFLLLGCSDRVVIFGLLVRSPLPILHPFAPISNHSSGGAAAPAVTVGGTGNPERPSRHHPSRSQSP